jgi:hypothetical protein
VVEDAWLHRGSREKAANMTLHANKLHYASVLRAEFVIPLEVRGQLTRVARKADLCSQSRME